MIKSIILLATAILSASCSLERNGTSDNLNYASTSSKLLGRIDNGVYFDPNGYFSVPVRHDYCGFKVEELSDQSNQRFNVSFSNDMGCLTRVEVLPNAKERMLQITDVSMGLNIFFELVFESIAKKFPGTKLIENKVVEIEGIGTCCLGVVFIPNGSTIRDAAKEKHEDAIRAYILSYAGDQLVVISVQESLLLTEFRKGNLEDEEKNNLLMNDAIKVRESYKNRS